MGSVNTLEERIIEKLAQHKKQLAMKQQQLDQDGDVLNPCTALNMNGVHGSEYQEQT